MALTLEGRALTERHRLEQARLAARAEAESRVAMRYLDIDALDASAAYWSAMQTGILRGHYMESQSLAARYVTDYRLAELGTASGVLVAPAFPDAAAQTMLRVTGPVAIKTMVGRGAKPASAFEIARRTVAGRAQKWALGGGRGAIVHTARADTRAKTYRRVCGAKPCAFCAMLVSRSIVGRSFSNVAFKAHSHCGCTAEIIYGAGNPTTEAEDSYIQAYDDAAKAADEAGEKRTAQNILPRMRASGLFRDSPAT